MPLTPYTNDSKPGEVYRDRDGSLWQTIGFITAPTAILVNVKTGERVYEVIGCPNAERWTRLIDQDKAG
jgi:hypothetical protein